MVQLLEWRPWRPGGLEARREGLYWWRLSSQSSSMPSRVRVYMMMNVSLDYGSKNSRVEIKVMYMLCSNALKSSLACCGHVRMLEIQRRQSSGT